jgi:hypothetical protein
MRSRQVVAGTAFAVLSPAVSHSCSVCFSGSGPRVLETYVLTAVLLTMLPVLIVAVFAVWLHRSFKAAGAPPSEGRSPEPHSSQA